MYFRQLLDPESSTYTYLLADEATGEAVIIDPVKEGVEAYLKLLGKEGFSLKYSLDTHVHADHITAGGTLRERTGCETGLHESTQAQCVSLRLKDGQTLKFGRYEIKVLHTPGHTPCHVSYLVEGRVFTGDSLLINGCGRTDFQKGSAAQQWDSIVDRLFSLPPDTLVYPGHNYQKIRVSTIQQEKDVNPRFVGKTKAEFIQLMNDLKLPDPKKIHEAVPANEVCGLR